MGDYTRKAQQRTWPSAPVRPPMAGSKSTIRRSSSRERNTTRLGFDSFLFSHFSFFHAAFYWGNPKQEASRACERKGSRWPDRGAREAAEPRAHTTSLYLGKRLSLATSQIMQFDFFSSLTCVASNLQFQIRFFKPYANNFLLWHELLKMSPAICQWNL